MKGMHGGGTEGVREGDGKGAEGGEEEGTLRMYGTAADHLLCGCGSGVGRRGERRLFCLACLTLCFFVVLDA